LNRDLIGIGIGTIASAFLGGLPVITVIVRSSVNINNQAKTRWSNFYHALFILIFILLLAPVIRMVPLAALAAILVFTGLRLASLRVFRQAYEQGTEQLLFLVTTLVVTLFTDLLVGILVGVITTLGVHMLLARMPIRNFFEQLFRRTDELKESRPQQYLLRIIGVANFLSLPGLNKRLSAVPADAQLSIDFSDARLVDMTVMEKLDDFRRNMQEEGGMVRFQGLDKHVSSSKHPLALKSQLQHGTKKLSTRQVKLSEMAETHDWEYRWEVDWDVSYLRHFRFFTSRPVESKTNVVRGSHGDLDIQWELSDITFDEGAMLATEVYRTTIQVLHLPFQVPEFVMEREGIFDKIFERVIPFKGKRDIDFATQRDFSSRFHLRGSDEAAIRSFFSPQLIHFFQQEDIYHIESNSEAILIFKYLRVARTEDVEHMLRFSEELCQHLIREKAAASSS